MTKTKTEKLRILHEDLRDAFDAKRESDWKHKKKIKRIVMQIEEVVKS